MDIEMAQLQLADLQAGHAQLLTREALQNRMFAKQKADLEAKIAKLQADIAAAQAPQV